MRPRRVVASEDASTGAAFDGLRASSARLSLEILSKTPRM